MITQANTVQVPEKYAYCWQETGLCLITGATYSYFTGGNVKEMQPLNVE